MRKYLSNLISIQQPSCSSLRCTDNDPDNGPLLKTPFAKTKKALGDKVFQIAALLLWNKLPRSTWEARNLESFKTIIKTFLYKESFQLSQ